MTAQHEEASRALGVSRDGAPFRSAAGTEVPSPLFTSGEVVADRVRVLRRAGANLELGEAVDALREPGPVLQGSAGGNRHPGSWWRGSAEPTAEPRTPFPEASRG